MSFFEDPNAGTYGWVEAPESTNIKRFRYDAPSRKLFVDFENGDGKVFYGVPALLAGDMKQARDEGRSAGKFFGKKIQRQFDSADFIT